MLASQTSSAYTSCGLPDGRICETLSFLIHFRGNRSVVAVDAPIACMAFILPNVGSSARDFCMLERNFLSHIKLALLLLLLFSSTVLQARLSGVDPSASSSRPSDISIALASLQLAAALCLVLGGFWEYESGFRDMRNMRAFLVSTK